jgi:hypothetical protein
MSCCSSQKDSGQEEVIKDSLSLWFVEPLGSSLDYRGTAGAVP